MNWLQRTAQMPNMNQIAFMLKQVFENSGPQSDINSAISMLRNIGPNEEICRIVKDLTTTYNMVDPSGASQKGRQLAEASGCLDFDPSDGMTGNDPNQMGEMPMLGEQEKPLDVPTATIE